MAIIKKTIKGLRPATDYLFTTKPKNTEVSASDNPPDAIRVTVPTYGSAPGTITNLQVVSRFETLSISFNPVTNIDLDYYEFQIFPNLEGTGTPLTSRLSLSEDGSYISGFNKSNSFSVSVQNSQILQVGVQNFGYSVKVRAVNTSKIASPWSNLVSAGITQLIGEQYIGSLNASRITTGTLQGATINMQDSNSVIKSSTYDPNAATPAGWFIRGDGHMSFGGPFGISYDGSKVTIGTAVNIQSSLSAGSISVGNGTYGYLTIDKDLGPGNADFGMELGDPTYNYWYANGKFSVGSASNYMKWNGTSLEVRGEVNATSGNINGTLNINSGLVISTTGSVRAGKTSYSDNTAGYFLGYSGVNPVFKIGNATNYLDWNGTSLVFTGSLNGAVGTFSGNLSSASGSVGSNFEIGNLLKVGNFVTINQAAVTNNTSLRVRGQTENSATSYSFIAENSVGDNVLLVSDSGRVTVEGAMHADTIYRRSNGGSLPAYSTQAAWGNATYGYTLGKFTSSSLRYKENISTSFDDFLDPKKLLEIPVVQFNYKDGVIGEGDSLLNRSVVGFLAEDFEQKYPSAVLYDENGSPENVYERTVVAGMLKLIQDLYIEIEQLKLQL